jgi:hypothetical protein
LQADAGDGADARSAACSATRPSPDSRFASVDLSRERERWRAQPLPFTGEVGNAPAFPGEGARR